MGKTREGNPSLREALAEAGYPSAQHRRGARHRGTERATVAAAHSRRGSDTGSGPLQRWPSEGMMTRVADRPNLLRRGVRRPLAGLLGRAATCAALRGQAGSA